MTMSSGNDLNGTQPNGASTSLPTLDWQTRAAQKRDACLAAIPDAWKFDQSKAEGLTQALENSKNNLIESDIVAQSGILTGRELDITSRYNVSTLLEKLASKEFSALEVTIAFSKRAAIAQQLTSCLTETFFERAQDRARHLDSLREGGTIVGPLHGLPISIKDNCQVAGTPATLGLVAYLDHQSEKDSAFVEILEKLGAVLYVKTNIPQTMMTADSHNNVFGRVLNPWNTALGAGGSSGGEGALVAFRGSPLGIGTDIGGSIRIPSLCCGTYGFKPTSNRLPYGGLQGCSDSGMKVVPACAGPLANDLEGLRILVDAVIGARPAQFDAAVFDLPWRQVESLGQSKLRLGILPEDPVFPLHPPVKKAVADSVRLLKEQGHELIPLSPEECQIAYACTVLWHIFALDDTADKIVKSGGEPAVPSIVRIESEARKLYDLLSAEMEDVAALQGLKRLSALNKKKAAVSAAWGSIWSKHKLDAIVGPGAQNTAIEHDMYGLPPYTSLLNLLDYPACVIPITKTDGYFPAEEPFVLGPRQIGPPYDANLCNGAPCSLQVFTNRMRDEECLEISKVIDNCLKQGGLN